MAANFQNMNPASKRLLKWSRRECRLETIFLLLLCLAIIISPADDFVWVFILVANFLIDSPWRPGPAETLLLPVTPEEAGKAFWISAIGLPWAVLAGVGLLVFSIKFITAEGGEGAWSFFARIGALFGTFGFAFPAPHLWRKAPYPPWIKVARFAAFWLCPTLWSLLLMRNAGKYVFPWPLLATLSLRGNCRAIYYWLRPGKLFGSAMPARPKPVGLAARTGSRRGSPKGWMALVRIQGERALPVLAASSMALVLSLIPGRGKIEGSPTSWLALLLTFGFLAAQHFAGPRFVLKLQNSARVLRCLPLRPSVIAWRLVFASAAPAVILDLLLFWFLPAGKHGVGFCLRFLFAGLAFFALSPWLAFRISRNRHPLDVAVALAQMAGGFIAFSIVVQSPWPVAALGCAVAVPAGWLWTTAALRDGPEAYAPREPFAGLAPSAVRGQSHDPWSVFKS